MPQRSVSMSVRLDSDDAAFLADLEIEGARTPSDKLRAVISEARQRRLLERDYEAALLIASNLFGRLSRDVRSAEQKLGLHVHSEVVTRTVAWLEEAAAFALSSDVSVDDPDARAVRELEEALIDRACSLLQSFLQLGMAPEGLCHGSEALEARLAPILKLASIIQQQRESQHG